MNIALSTVCLTEMPWQDVFRQAAAAGYRYVELLMVPNWHHVQPGEVPAQTMLDEARAAGVSIMGLHAGAIDGSSDEALAGTVEYIERAIETAADLGVDLVVFTGMPTPPDVARPVLRERIARGLQSLLPRLARQEVRVGLENHYQCQIEPVEDFASIFSQLGNQVRIGATVDTGHFTASGISPAWVVETLGTHVNHVHIKNHVGAQSVALGRGQTDLKAVITALRTLNYDGWLTVELEVADRENAVRYVQESLPYMQQLLAVPS